MLVPLIAASAMAAQTHPAERLAGWGFEAVELIRQHTYLPEKLLYAETTEKRTPAFNWGVGVMLSALNAAARLNPKYRPWLEEYATASHLYWNEKGPVPGYDVTPAPKGMDRYYDDNGWMALQLLEAYDTLRRPKYLSWAKQTLRYVLSGEDKVNGGIFWHETDKKGRNTCSSAPAAAACLAMFRHTHDSRLLVAAIRIYSWTKRTLQDPGDHLMWDSIGQDGTIHKEKWSYNTALMIRSAGDLFAITRNKAYRQDLIAMQSASARRWLREALRDEGRFAHLLLDAWIYQRQTVPVATADQKGSDARAILEPLVFLHSRARSTAGFYGKRFDRPPEPTQKYFDLIDQASAARAYLSAAEYYGKQR